MHRLATPSRSTAVSRRAPAALAVVAAALTAAFVLAPPGLAAGDSGGELGDSGHLVGALRAAFVDYWRSGDRAFPPNLQRVVDYWFRYHLVKAMIAAALLVVLVTLGVLVWKAFLRAGDRPMRARAALASAGVLVTVFATTATAAVMANVQGALAPFASLLPMLTDGPADGELADTLAQVRRQLADPSSSEVRNRPAVEAMISHFAHYHSVMAVVAATVAVVLAGVGVVLWSRRAAVDPSARRTRRVLGSYGVASGLLCLAVIAVVVANATTAADPVPALRAFFAGGW
ncbi:hypothetical protein [Micromonospora siamensis]|uniref:Uncharacterized protein n=1 Tax=Micromonospora siamensis TaxID=299152 RepID=A0A1C5HWB1_9ACTN|nr:hypothetical protein [Micromonospora siamensis]SCG50345.1 hypothetical protein GA0074704_2481 [Micromonospora siamensis]